MTRAAEVNGGKPVITGALGSEFKRSLEEGVKSTMDLLRQARTR